MSSFPVPENARPHAEGGAVQRTTETLRTLKPVWLAGEEAMDPSAAALSSSCGGGGGGGCGSCGGGGCNAAPPARPQE